MAESYHRWRLPQLWEMVAADNATDAHLHLATLRRQQTALETQRDSLRTLRDHLSEAWPPTKSEAATAFIQQINDMIDAMTLTARGAGEVRASLTHVVDAIGRARAELESLVTQYAKATAVADPRIGAHAQRALDDQARRVLVSADATVAQALEHLDVPLPAYARFSWNRQEEPAATVPATTSPAGSSTAGGSHGSSLTRTALLPPRFDPPSPVPGHDPVELAGVAPADDLTRTPSDTHTLGPAAGAIDGRSYGNPGGGLVLRGPIGGGAEPVVSRTAPLVSGRLRHPAARPPAAKRQGGWSPREGPASVLAADRLQRHNIGPGHGTVKLTRGRSKKASPR